MPISLSGSLLITGSITTTGGITISGSILSASYAATSSFSNDFTVLGNLTVFGTQSIQYITSSQLNISDNVITVNVASPGVRFGGLSVFDSGSQSSEATASLFWDSQQNHWIYQRESGSSYDGGMLISGPRNAAGLGNEQGTTACRLLVGQGGDHLTSSLVYHDSIRTCVPNILNVGGVLSGSSAAFSGNVTLGIIGGGIATSTPSTINLTSTFSSTPGSNLKLKLFEDTGGNVYGIGVSNTQMDFNVATGGNYRFYTGNVLADCKVGIGTCCPDRQLDVFASGQTAIARIRGNTSNGAALTVANSENSQDISIYSAGTSGFGIAGWANNAVIESSTGIVYSAYNGSHIFQSGVSGRTERMRITSTGTLELKSSTALNSMLLSIPFNAPAYNLLSLNGTNIEGQYIGLAGGGTADTALYYQSGNCGSHIFRTGDGTNFNVRMRINSCGNVLIAKTTNSARLAGPTVEAEGTFYSGGNQGGYFFEDRSNSTFWYGWYSTGNTNVFFYNGNTGTNIASINPSTGAYTALSDINKKKDFEQSTIGLNAILGLKPTLYRIKTDETEADKELGIIAQEVREFIPQAFVERGEDENKFIGLNYNAIVAALVKSVQEQQCTINTLKTCIGIA